MYESIVKYDENSNAPPTIINIDKYNEMCKKNEEYMIEIILNYLFE